MPTALLDALASAYTTPPADRRVLSRFRDLTARFSSLTYDDVAQLAADIPQVFTILGSSLTDLSAFAWFYFKVTLPGKTLESKTRRVFDPTFWRRLLWLRVLQSQELARIAAGEVSEYASPVAVAVRRRQKQRQAEWVKNSSAVACFDGTTVRIPLEKLIKTAEQRMAKVYAFVSAIDRLAIENNLEMALITTTLPGDWHSNPQYKRRDWAWNGKSPKECANELTRLFQNVRRDLDNAGVYLSGLWAGELHKDGTPHRHYWCCYRPEHASLVRSVFLKYFPGKLKLRRGHKRLDRAYLTSADALADSYVLLHDRPKLKRSGFQVDVSVIDRTRGSGASYCFKYLEKAMLQDAAFEANPSLQAIDAARSLWRMRSFDFFGVQKCLGRWDEIRRLTVAPADPFLHQQWVAARGGELEGRVPSVVKEDGKSAPVQQGDAYAFLQLNGGLAALRSVRVSTRTAKATSTLSLYKGLAVGQYGDPVKRVKGVAHISKCWSKSGVKACPDTGEVATYQRGALAGSPKLHWRRVEHVVAVEISRPHTWQVETTAPVEADRSGEETAPRAPRVAPPSRAVAPYQPFIMLCLLILAASGQADLPFLE